MTIRRVPIHVGQLREHLIDYAGERIALRFDNSQTVILTFKEARALRLDWSILLTRAAVRRGKARGERGGFEVVDAVQLPERASR